MKEYMMYKCDTCGHTSVSKEEVEKCESSHISPLLFGERKYFDCSCRNNYPDMIRVKFEDGNWVDYNIDYETQKKQRGK